MPSLDERREVAARLREIDDTEWTHPRDELRALDEAIGTSQRMPYAIQTTWDRLADLIEPEPERTCEWTWEHSGPLFDSFKCSECLYEFFEPRCVHGYSELVANYCPNCGARVVEE